MADDIYASVPSTDSMNWDHQSIPMDEGTLLDLSTFFGIGPELCQARLNQYRMAEMADEWKKADPRSPEEIRKFYQETELYIWELTKWHASPSYDSYKRRVAETIKEFPPASHPRVLDFGSGIATASLEFARAGYKVTIADVPGQTLAYAKHRLSRRGLDCRAIEVSDEVPRLRDIYDIIVSFDVLEHIPNAELILKALAAALRSGGAALINANFDDCGEHPQHLSSNRKRFSALRWDWAVAGSGLRHLSSEVLIKAPMQWTLPRKLRWGMHRVFPGMLSQEIIDSLRIHRWQK